MNVHACTTPVRSVAGTAGDRRLRDLFFFDMAEAGIYLARRGFIALMLPIGDDETERVAQAVQSFLQRQWSS